MLNENVCTDTIMLFLLVLALISNCIRRSSVNQTIFVFVHFCCLPDVKVFKSLQTVSETTEDDEALVSPLTPIWITQTVS